jgi:hypothetical protein
MSQTLKQIKDVLAELDDGNIEKVYKEFVATVQEATISYEKKLIDKLNVLKNEDKITQEDLVEVVCEMRWQALATVTAQAGLDRGLKASTVAGEVLQKYESISAILLNQALTNTLQNVASNTDSNKLNDFDVKINSFIHNKDKSVLH